MSKKADLITIGQWLEKNVYFQSFEKPYTSNEKYEEIGDKFVRYVIKIKEYQIFMPKEDLHEQDVHTTMKLLLTYRLTPHAIAFMKNNVKESDFIFEDDDIKDNHFSKTLMYLSNKALCKFNIIIRPWDIERTPFHIRDYFENYPDEDFIVELDGLESIEKGEGKNLVQNALYVMQEVPILLQAGFLHYGDYECEEGMERVNKLVNFYKDLGFENINNTIGNYEESVMMIVNKDWIKEESFEKE